MGCTCSIIPKDVLERLAADPTLDDDARRSMLNAALLDTEIRELRAASSAVTRVASMSLIGATTLAPAPTINVYDCRNSMSLPGVPIPDPSGFGDSTAKRTLDETTAVVDFLQTAFGRNSIDDGGMTLLSSIHFGRDFNNAKWTGTQMLYGDGDGKIFLDFTLANDVIGHEIAHGITQYTSDFEYSDEAGGLNESISDVIGSMFRQWRLNQDVSSADWLIGANIMGPVARSRGFRCLRDMSNPGGSHCLAAQPSHYSDYQPGMDPHYSSGIPNFAFYNAAMTMGGQSWNEIGTVWYQALTAYGISPDLGMAAFADRTRDSADRLFSAKPQVRNCIDQGWASVGL
jgi:Zn-dependent metalloprotease